MVGLIGHRNSFDEKLLEATRCAAGWLSSFRWLSVYLRYVVAALLYRLATPTPAQLLVIVDVRPKLNAVANQVWPITGMSSLFSVHRPDISPMVPLLPPQTQGKGYETVGPGTNYPNACLHFMGGECVHVLLSRTWRWPLCGVPV